MSRFWKIIAGILGGLILASLGGMIFAIMFGTPDDGSAGTGAFFVLWLLSFILAIMSRSAGKAWRKLLFISAALSFALPLSTLVFSGRSMAEAEGGAEALGTAIGGGLIAVFAGFVGFFLGIVFLILGFVVGRGDVDVHTSEPLEVRSAKN